MSGLDALGADAFGLTGDDDEFDGPTCRQCGCTEHDACVDDAGQPCAWFEPDLCTVCAGDLDDLPAFPNLQRAGVSRKDLEYEMGALIMYPPDGETKVGDIARRIRSAIDALVTEQAERDAPMEETAP